MKKYLYSIAVAVLALTACTKEYENTYIITPDDLEDGIMTQDELTVILPEQTKTYLDGYNVLWQGNDKITAWSSYNEDAKTFTIDAQTIGSNTATFKTDPGKGVKFPVEGVTTFYAVYPSNNSKSITVRSTQDWKGFKDFAQNVNPMIGRSTDFNKIEFINPCSIFAINLIADGQVKATLNSIVLSSETKILSGTAEVHDWNVEKLTDVDLDWTTSSNTVTLRGGSSEIISTEKSTYYIVVPAGKYSDLTVTVNYRSDTIRKITKLRLFDEERELLAGRVFEYTAPIKLDTKKPEPPVTYKVGDVYPKKEGETPVGVVFYAAADGLSGKVVALEDCEEGGTPVTDAYGTFHNYMWGSYTSITSAEDGADNTSEIGNLSPAVVACVNYKKGDLDWYLPAVNEFNAMKAASANFKETTGFRRLLGDNYWTSTISEIPNGKLVTNSIGYYTLVGTAPNNNVILYAPVATLSSNATLKDGASVRAIAEFKSK